MDRNYTSPSFRLEEVSWEGFLAASEDTPARGYENSALEDLE